MTETKEDRGGSRAVLREKSVEMGWEDGKDCCWLETEGKREEGRAGEEGKRHGQKTRFNSDKTRTKLLLSLSENKMDFTSTQCSARKHQHGTPITTHNSPPPCHTIPNAILSVRANTLPSSVSRRPLSCPYGHSLTLLVWRARQCCSYPNALASKLELSRTCTKDSS